MTYHYDPQKTRGALERIRARFPLHNEGKPLGLDQLFSRLEQMHPSTAALWGERLSHQEINLLCAFFHRTQSARVLLAISAILVHRGDLRCCQVIHYFMLLLPKEGDLRSFAGYWGDPTRTEFIAGNLPWVVRFLRQSPMPAVDQYVREELLAGRLTLAILEANFSRDTPVFERLTSFLFDEGAAFLSGLQPDIANERVSTYLEREDLKRLRNFLVFYPETQWQPQFLEKLYREKGPLDEHRSKFYRSLEKGSLWKVRQAMFRPRIESISADRLEFWQRWLHRMSDLKWIQGIVHIYLHPLKIVEEPERSLVFLQASTGVDPIEIIVRDPYWERRMEEILAEYAHWQ